MRHCRGEKKEEWKKIQMRGEKKINKIRRIDPRLTEINVARNRERFNRAYFCERRCRSRTLKKEKKKKTRKKRNAPNKHPHDLERQRSSHGEKKEERQNGKGVCHPIKAYISHSFENLSQECTRSSVHLLYYCLLTRINMRIKNAVWFICTRWVQDSREQNANERPGERNGTCFAKMCVYYLCEIEIWIEM